MKINLKRLKKIIAEEFVREFTSSVGGTGATQGVTKTKGQLKAKHNAQRTAYNQRRVADRAKTTADTDYETADTAYTQALKDEPYKFISMPSRPGPPAQYSNNAKAARSRGYGPWGQNS